MRVGLVSDTHGLFEPRLRDLFGGCDLILHAGDIVAPAILGELARIAPVRAVRGNNDIDPAFEALPEVATVPLGKIAAVLVHRVGTPDLDLPVRRAVARSGGRVVVYGHSHRPGVALVGALLLVNPGAAGPRRFSLPRSAGILDVDGTRIEVSLFDLAARRLTPLGPPLVTDLGRPPTAP